MSPDRGWVEIHKIGPRKSQCPKIRFISVDIIANHEGVVAHHFGTDIDIVFVIPYNFIRSDIVQRPKELYLGRVEQGTASFFYPGTEFGLF